MSDQFDSWLDDFFASYFRRRPVCATFIGRHEQDHRLPDYSEEGVSEALAELTELERQLEEIQTDSLSETQQIDRKLAEGALTIQQWELESTHYRHKNPAFYTGKAMFGVIALFLRDYAPVEKRVEAAISRMSAIPEFLHTAAENLDEIPDGWVDRALSECDAARAFFGDGIDQLATTYKIDDTEFRSAGDAAGDAFSQFQEFLNNAETVPHGHACGAEAFEQILSEGHHFDESADKLLAQARAELERCEQYLETHAEDFDADNRDEALAALEENYPDVSEYYDRYQEVWNKCRELAEDADVVTWPEYPLEFVPRPEWSREAARDLYFLFYRAPAAYDDVTPVEYLVEPIEPEMDSTEIQERLRRNNDSQIKSNHVAHHAGIGHHVQNWYAYNRGRSRIGQVAAVDCASRIAFYAGGTMAEGWACYATELMDELDFFSPLESYALHYSRLRFAARAIVDIKLHCGQLSHEEAVTFYQERAGMSEEAAQYEVTRNGMFPGMAVMYLQPMEVIHELRAELEAENDDFTLRQFHDEFLSYGSIPVPLIAEIMRSKYLS